MTTLSFTKQSDGSWVSNEYKGGGGGLEVRCAPGTTVTVSGDVSGHGDYTFLGNDTGALVTGKLDMDGLTAVKIICVCKEEPSGYTGPVCYVND